MPYILHPASFLDRPVTYKNPNYHYNMKSHMELHPKNLPEYKYFLIVLFWENINEIIYKRFNIKINYIVAIIIVAVLGIIFTLLYF